MIENIRKGNDMKKVASFMKVSFEEFLKDYSKKKRMSHLIANIPWIEKVEKLYNQIVLPTRATQGSAGHDFCCYEDITIKPNETVLIPTGIRCHIDNGWVLKIYPRSSLGFKYKLRLNNTCGIIDSDYFYADNEGHIFIKMTNESDETVKLKANDAFAQGIFVEYGITYDDNVTTQRTGGIGSTNKN